MAKRRDLTSSEINAADRLKAAFLSTRSEHGLTYEQAGALLGWTAGNFSQYLNKKIPLNMPSLIKMCSIIPRANPKEIYPELFEGTNISFSGEDSGDEELLRGFKSLSEDLQDAVRAIIALNRNP